MLTEPTGTHFLDSGGESGRHWQRLAGVDVSQAMTLPEATADEWGVTLSAFHYIRRRVETLPSDDLAALAWQAILADQPDESYWECAEVLRDYVKDHGGTAEPETWNTYNWETALSRTLQGFAFTLPGSAHPFLWLQSHNGADVRGGYSSPRIFAIPYLTGRHDADTAGLCFIASASEYTLDCDDCGHWINCTGGDYLDAEGGWLDRDDAQLHHPYPCGECGAKLTPNAPEPSHY
jgi:hypothetical protein